MNGIRLYVGWVSGKLRNLHIESRGKPKVFILSFAEYQQFLALREQARRKEAFQS